MSDGLFLKSALRADLIINVSSPKTYQWKFEKADGSGPEDWTGSTFELRVSARDSNREPTGANVLTLETGAGIAGDAAVGEVQPTFDAGALVAGTKYVYQLDRLDDSSPPEVVETVMVGMIDTVGGVA